MPGMASSSNHPPYPQLAKPHHHHLDLDIRRNCVELVLNSARVSPLWTSQPPKEFMAVSPGLNSISAHVALVGLCVRRLELSPGRPLTAVVEKMTSHTTCNLPKLYSSETRHEQLALRVFVEPCLHQARRWCRLSNSAAE
ncbi:hypothetical protein VTK26DRAFT_7845 [Humicola hyalothermophila]